MSLLKHWKYLIIALLIALAGSQEYRIHSLKESALQSQIEAQEQRQQAVNEAKDLQKELNSSSAKVDESYAQAKARVDSQYQDIMDSLRHRNNRLSEQYEAIKDSSDVPHSSSSTSTDHAASGCHIPRSIAADITRLGRDADTTAERLKAAQNYINSTRSVYSQIDR